MYRYHNHHQLNYHLLSSSSETASEADRHGPALVCRSNNPTEVRGLRSIFTFQLSATEATTKMKLVSRKVPKTLEDETVSLLPEDPEDMVSKTAPLVPCDSQTLASSEAEP